MIHICLASQTLVHVTQPSTTSFPISSSKHGHGQSEGSYQTPLGAHHVHSIIGLNQPIFTQFSAREPIMHHASCPDSTEDLILSRIIRLKGLEDGYNAGHDQNLKCVDSFHRYIYIHGTNQENLIGRKASIGCIRMLNHDIISLCHQISINEKVHIACSIEVQHEC